MRYCYYIRSQSASSQLTPKENLGFAALPDWAENKNFVKLVFNSINNCESYCQPKKYLQFNMWGRAPEYYSNRFRSTSGELVTSNLRFYGILWDMKTDYENRL